MLWRLRTITAAIEWRLIIHLRSSLALPPSLSGGTIGTSIHGSLHSKRPFGIENGRITVSNAGADIAHRAALWQFETFTAHSVPRNGALARAQSATVLQFYHVSHPPDL